MERPAECIRNAISLPAFRSRLKTHLFARRLSLCCRSLVFIVLLFLTNNVACQPVINFFFTIASINDCLNYLLTVYKSHLCDFCFLDPLT